MNNKTIQQTLVVVKPDGLKKSLTGNILTRLSELKLRIVGAKVVRVSRELAEKHYAHLKNESFYEEIIKYIQGKLHGSQYERVMAIVYEGENAIKEIRQLAGATNPELAESTSIRGQYGRVTTKGLFENVIHCSENEQGAEKEIRLWFEPTEIIDPLYPTEEIELKIKKLVWK